MPSLPTPGVTTSWGDDLNAAIESLNSQGTHAARPTSGIVTGSLYFCSDHDTVYRWNGTAWVTWVGVGGAGCSAYNTAGTSIPHNTTTLIPLGAEDFDTHGYHDNTTNPTRLTIPAGLGGIYDVFPQVAYGYNASGVRSVSVLKNGFTLLDLGWDPSISSMGLTSTAVTLAAGDYLELGTYQNTGAAITVNATTTRLTIVRLGD